MKKYLILLLLTSLTSLLNAQSGSVSLANTTSKQKKTVKKSIPKAYNTIVTKQKALISPPEKRILKIDLDSLLLNNGQTIREIIKGDSTNTIIDYSINLYQMPTPFNDSIQKSNLQGNLYLRITEVQKAKFAVYKQAESDRINKEIERIDKEKADKIKQRDDIRKQN